MSEDFMALYNGLKKQVAECLNTAERCIDKSTNLEVKIKKISQHCDGLMRSITMINFRLDEIQGELEGEK